MSWALCVSVEAGKLSSIHLDVILHELKKTFSKKMSRNSISTSNEVSPYFVFNSAQARESISRLSKLESREMRGTVPIWRDSHNSQAAI